MVLKLNRLKVLIFSITFTIFIFSINECFGDIGIKNVGKKIIFTEWLQESSLKYGFLSSLCAQGIFTGLVESSKYGGHHVVDTDDYHIYRYAQDISSLTSGWLLYATVRNEKITFWRKVRRITGVACFRRNCLELAYRANVTGDPFNYSDKYSSNKKAIVYFKWDGNKGKFVDLYISGTGKQGAFIDLAFFLIGRWLFK